MVIFQQPRISVSFEKEKLILDAAIQILNLFSPNLQDANKPIAKSRYTCMGCIEKEGKTNFKLCDTNI